MLSAKQLFDRAIFILRDVYPIDEAKEIAFLLINHLTGFSKTDILVDKTIAIFDEDNFKRLLDRLSQNEPIQYVIEKAHFLGRDFFVNKYTLIPRPETEELVSLILAENEGKSDLKILDIGTGSGCIPISLQLQMPKNQYTAIDISKSALEVARKNAIEMNAHVDFRHGDIIKLQNRAFVESKFDIIISNPPYVLESDKAEMKANVLEYEPHKALFVADEKPLHFYKAILNFAQYNLKRKGKLYFEIHEKKALAMRRMIYAHHFQEISIKRDFNKKPRFAIGTFAPR